MTRRNNGNNKPLIVILSVKASFTNLYPLPINEYNKRRNIRSGNRNDYSEYRKVCSIDLIDF